MKTYIIYPKNSYTESFTGYKKQFLNASECIQWIENTLDLPQNWAFKLLD